MIVLPAIDLRGGKAVRLLRGEYDNMTVYGENPVAVAASFANHFIFFKSSWGVWGLLSRSPHERKKGAGEGELLSRSSPSPANTFPIYIKFVKSVCNNSIFFYLDNNVKTAGFTPPF